MQTALRQWEMRFRVGMNRDPGKVEHPYEVCVFGETVQGLRQKVLEYLKKYRPSYFDNYYGDHVAGYQMYACSDGKMRPPAEWGLDRQLFQEEEGWWYYPRQLVSGSLKRDDHTPFPLYLGRFEDAALKFVTSALIPRKGPDYQSQAVVENQLQLPLLETVLREAEEHRLNDLLLRGWHILALEYQGEVNKTGELTNRKAHFVLGHTDLPAARYSLEPRDAYYIHAYRRSPESTRKSNSSTFFMEDDARFSYSESLYALIDETDPSPTSQWVWVKLFIASNCIVSHWVDTLLAMLTRVLSSQGEVYGYARRVAKTSPIYRRRG